MKRYRPPKEFPVSQRQMARYLGITHSTLSMSKGKQLNRTMPGDASLKSIELRVLFQQQKDQKPGVSVLAMQPAFIKAANKEVNNMLIHAGNYDYRAWGQQRQLDEMIRRNQVDTQWLNTIDQKLSMMTKTEQNKMDWLWLQIQQQAVIRRLERNGRLAQARLELRIELAKKQAAIYIANAKKLKKEIK